MSDAQHLHEPFFKKLSYSLLAIVLIGLIVHLGKNILIPIFFSILLSALLLPVTNFLKKKHFHRILAILLPLITSLLIILAVVYFLSSQIAHFFDNWDELKDRFSELADSIQHWISHHLNITISKQEQYIDQTTEKVKTVGPKLVGQTFLSLTETISYVILLPFYTFLILYYRGRLKTFLVELFKNSNKSKILDIIHQSRSISQQYIGGLLVETCIIFALNSLGFIILGIQYAVFLALTAALLNLVPYIGMVVANVLCITVTFISSEHPFDALWVGGILALVQVYDNNIGMPMIVGNNVRINALATIIGILVGGALCGIPGMFLAIPTLAVLKVIFDRVPELHAWGILLGENVESKNKKTPGALLKKLKKKL